MDELSEITDYVQAAAGQSADIIHGYGIDPTLGDEVRVTLIATGFKNKNSIGLGLENSAKQSRKVIVLTADHEPVQETTQEFVQEVLEKVELPKIIRSLEDVIEEEISEINYASNIEISEESLSPNFSEQENQLKVEFEINQISAYAESLEPVLKSEIVSATSAQENEVSEMSEGDKRSNERVNKLRQFNYRQKLQQGQINELQNVPAYIRKNVDLDDVAHSSETNISKYTLGEGEDGKGELRQNNSFLHDNVD